MPLPIVTCLLVLAAIIAQADTLTGVAVAGSASIIQFFLPPISAAAEPGVPDGTPDRDTYSL